MTKPSLFTKRPTEPPPLIVYCSGCGEHFYKVSAETVDACGIVSLKCPVPSCGAGTSLSIAPNGNVIVVPGYPEDNLPKKKPRIRKAPAE